MSTKVINLHNYKGKFSEWISNPNNVYIGRRLPFLPDHVPATWGNPYRPEDYESNGRDCCIKDFHIYFLKSRKLKKNVHLLKGKTLGCFCIPFNCHGHILAKYADETNEQGVLTIDENEHDASTQEDKNILHDALNNARLTDSYIELMTEDVDEFNNTHINLEKRLNFLRNADIELSNEETQESSIPAPPPAPTIENLLELSTDSPPPNDLRTPPHPSSDAYNFPKKPDQNILNMNIITRLEHLEKSLLGKISSESALRKENTILTGKLDSLSDKITSLERNHDKLSQYMGANLILKYLVSQIGLRTRI